MLWNLSKRPAEELYDLQKDPDQLVNVTADPHYAKTLQSLQAALKRWRTRTQDPVPDTGPEVFDSYRRYSDKD